MIETGGFSWLDIVRALCRIVRDSFVQQDCCVMALDDTLLLRSSKTAPGAARRFDHAGKPNRPRHVLAQNLVSLSTVIGPPGRRRSLPLVSRLSDLTAASWPRSSLAPCCTSFAPTSFSWPRGSVARASSSGPWRVASPSLARRVSTRRSSSGRGAGADGRPSTACGSSATSSPSCREAPRRLPQCADPLPQLPGPLPRRSGGPRRLDLAARQGALDQEPAAAVDRSDHAAGGDHPALCRPLDN